MGTTGSGAKAIETAYKGYRFRSRLEARWAVFFDAIEMSWEYEKEGFDLGGGIFYLPDFYLQSLDCWVEIKPIAPTDLEIEKCRLLSEQSGKKVYLFAINTSSLDILQDKNRYKRINQGRLTAQEWVLLANLLSNTLCFWRGECNYGYFWEECPFCGVVGITSKGVGTNMDICHCMSNTILLGGFYPKKLMAGFNKFRSARFEHGEKG